MSEQTPQQNQQPSGQPEQTPLQQDLGDQGNIGQYGQGQYTNEGKPDMHAPEGQQLKPTNPPSTTGDATNDNVSLEDLQIQENNEN